MTNSSTSNDTISGDILYGYHEIGRFLNMTARQAEHRGASGVIPTFKVGRKVAARKSTLREWLQRLEREAIVEADAARAEKKAAASGRLGV